MTDKEADAIGTLIALVCLPFLFFAEGWVLSWLWFWFLVPMGLPVVSWAQAYGIAIFGWLAVTSTKSKPETKSDPLDDVGRALARYSLAFGFGYIAHRIMVG